MTTATHRTADSNHRSSDRMSSSKPAGTAHFATVGWLQWLASLQPRREQEDDDGVER